MHGNLEFAVLDVETTGFSPRLHDRIIEVGIVRVDGACNVIREYGTLINPNRDVGPTHVHGIRAADVREAPFFEEVVGDIQDAIRGTILVAHNASFDLRFLTYQCNACQSPLPPIDYLCTLQLAKIVGVNVPSRKLGVLCEAFGIPAGQAHSALDDARVTAMLLGKLLQRAEGVSSPAKLSALGIKTVPSPALSWAESKPSRKEYRRSSATARKQNAGGWLSRLFSALPAQNRTHNSADEYLVVLECALEDRMISDAEIAALSEVATSLDMDQSEVQEAHMSFLQDVVRAAWLDKTITEAERRDIDLVAKLLGISEEDYQGMIALVQAEGTPVARVTPTSHVEFASQEICFTGSFSSLQNGERVTRDMMEALAVEHGMIVKKGVTKSLNILVCADPDTMSNKGRKAREYGVRIIAEPAFFKMLGL